MRSRRSSQEHVAEVARRRLELLSAELAEIRPDPVATPRPRDPGGSGGPPGASTRPATPPDDADPPGSPGPTEAPGWIGSSGSEPGGARGRHAHRSVGPAAALGGWTQDRLPATLQGRVRLAGAHLAVLGLLVLAALALGAWAVLGARGHETALPPVSSPPSALVSVPTASSTPAAVASSGVPAAPAAASPTGRIVVDVAGKVRRPGIATLPLGARVVDALRAAGGARPGVRLGGLNLARVLADGEQILVGVPPVPGVAASAASVPGGSASATPMIALNTASQADLEELPGIGPVTAQAILTYRTENGAFTSVDELLEVSGIGDATLAKIAPYVTL